MFLLGLIGCEFPHNLSFAGRYYACKPAAAGVCLLLRGPPLIDVYISFVFPSLDNLHHPKYPI
jgi:hypothetical protein